MTRFQRTGQQVDATADLMTPQRREACRIARDFFADTARLLLVVSDGIDVLEVDPWALLDAADQEPDDRVRETAENCAMVLIAWQVCCAAVGGKMVE